MTDDLDRLKSALEAGTPAPRAAARDAALRTALENFDVAAQGSEDTKRLTQTRPHPVAGVWKGVLEMLSKRTALYGTASVATALVAVVLVTDYQPAFMRSTAINGSPQATEMAETGTREEGAGALGPAARPQAKSSVAAEVAPDNFADLALEAAPADLTGAGQDGATSTGPLALSRSADQSEDTTMAPASPLSVEL